MATIAVDTLRLARGLEAAGFPTSQAQGAAEAIAEAITEGVATRSDLREVELRLSGRIEETRLSLDRRIEETRLGLEKQLAETRLGLEARVATSQADLMRWMFGAVGLQVLAILGGVAALIKLVH